MASSIAAAKASYSSKAGSSGWSARTFGGARNNRPVSAASSIDTSLYESPPATTLKPRRAEGLHRSALLVGHPQAVADDAVVDRRRRLWQKIVGHCNCAISGRANSANVSDSRTTWTRARSVGEEVGRTRERAEAGDDVRDQAQGEPMAFEQGQPVCMSAS